MPTEIEHEDDNLRPRVIKLRPAASNAIRLLHLAVDDLNSRRGNSRRMAIGAITGAISELEAGLRHETETATRDLSENLVRALDPLVTVAEIEGARTIVELILAALPPKVELRGGAR